MIHAPMRNGRFHVIAVSVWALLLVGGLGALGAHAARAGSAGNTPEAWPEAMQRSPGRWTVVLAAHPRCPCTRSTADELIGALQGATEPYEVIVLAYTPPDEVGFSDTGVIRRLGGQPHTTMVRDPDGRTAALFGAMTSGHAAVYDPQGNLRFRGDLTPSRAHVGPNTGAASLRALLRGETAFAPDAPVYGCPLDNSIHTLLGACSAEGDATCTP